jgi:CpeT protein
MKMKKKSIILLTTIVLSAFSTFGQSKISNGDLKKLFKTMTGSFSSVEQSKTDTNYYDIRLHMTPIWQERGIGYWLYVEQAMGEMQEKPYRQRIYRLFKINDTTVVSQVYNIKDPLRFAGVFKTKNPLTQLTIDSIESKRGCAIFLVKDANGNYKGSTNGKDCPSNLRGATYTTSNVSITNDRIVSWDQGFDANDKQVWGATTGGYQFIKQAE